MIQVFYRYCGYTSGDTGIVGTLQEIQVLMHVLEAYSTGDTGIIGTLQYYRYTAGELLRQQVRLPGTDHRLCNSTVLVAGGTTSKE